MKKYKNKQVILHVSLTKHLISISVFFFSRYLEFPFLQIQMLTMQYQMRTVSLYNLEDKQIPRTKPSMYSINIHIGELKRAFI